MQNTNKVQHNEYVLGSFLITFIPKGDFSKDDFSLVFVWRAMAKATAVYMSHSK